jgi:L-aspartate oxidase
VSAAPAASIEPSTIPARLAAPDPGWTTTADVIVVGSGIAGISTALRARAAGLRVLVVTKARISEGASGWAQGGIAAVLGRGDTPAQHIADTLVAGAGLCDPAAVAVLVHAGAPAVRALVEFGTRFDRTASGEFALTREGGHGRDRIAHAGGDATGAEIMRALIAAAGARDGLEIIENALALDLLVDRTGAAQGITLHVMGEGRRDGVGAALAPAVVLATGGLGQIYAQTTNPAVSTGDGVALALRAGAEVADLEFLQFHPTVLWLGPQARGQQPLVSEAVRGEGAVLVDDDGHRFMVGEHPQAELAPRDVVAKAITRRMMATGAQHVWLDGRRLGTATWRTRFPTILASCRDHGIDPVLDLVPVAPAQHYASGGVRTDLAGRTTVPGLFAAGEVSCTGVHGANRLASNSLLEGAVFGTRIGDQLAAGLPPRREPVGPAAAAAPSALVDEHRRGALQTRMLHEAGVLRDAGSLAGAGAFLADLGAAAGAAAGTAGGPQPCTESWETTNLQSVAALVVASAAARTESRGSHWRADFPDRDDERWRVRVVQRLDPDGALRRTLDPVPPA